MTSREKLAILIEKAKLRHAAFKPVKQKRVIKSKEDRDQEWLDKFLVRLRTQMNARLIKAEVMRLYQPPKRKERQKKWTPEYRNEYLKERKIKKIAEKSALRKAQGIDWEKVKQAARKR